MALLPQILPLQFGKLDTKTDSRFLVPGGLVALRNIRYDSFPKLLKRWGTATFYAAAAGRMLAHFKNQLFLGTGAEAYSIAATGSLDKGMLEAVTLLAQPVVRNAYYQQSPDVAVHPNGITVYTYESNEAGSLVSRYSVFDTATQQPIAVNVLISATGVRPKPLCIGNWVAIVYVDTSTSHVRYLAIPVASPTSPTSPADLATDSQASPVFDATVIGGLQGLVYVAYANAGGSIAVCGLSAGLAVAPPTVLFNAVPTVLSIWQDAALNLWLCYYASGNLTAAVFTSALSVITAPFTVAAAPGTVRNITGIAPGAVSTIYYEVSAAATYNNFIRTATSTLAGTVTGVADLVRSVGLASKAFYYLGRVHVLAAFQTTLQPTYFLLSNGKVVGKLAPGNGGGLTQRLSLLPETPSVSTGVYALAYLYADQLTSVAGNVFSQAGVNAATVDFTQNTYSTELSDNLHVSGGIVSMYDGAAVCEHGFNVYPEPLTFTASGSGSFTGSYQACAVYEWMDNYGNIHQSSPSPVVTATASSAAQFNFSVPMLRLTSKVTKVSVVFYRTIANQPVFYRVSSISTPTLNDPTTDTASTTDITADTSITGNAQLVFNPDNSAAEVPPLAAPALSFITRYRTRLVGIPSENPYQWIYSKAMVPGGVPMEWNDQQFYQAIPQGSGPLTCAMEMDEKLILFTATRIMMVAGDGPAPNGANGDYGTAPQHIPADVGCANPRSLVLTPMGIIFQSQKGFYLLDRGVSLHYIGGDVEKYNGQNVTSAQLLPNTRRVLFTMSSGLTLAFDYIFERWSEWTGVYGADATIFNGLWTFVTPSGQVKQETPGIFVDDGVPVLIGLTTGWASFAGVSGYQRVWRLIIRGDYRSPHILQISIAVDDRPSPVQVETVNTANLFANTPGDTLLGDTESPGDGAFPPEEWQVKLLQQKCSSLQVSIQESQLGPSYGEGLSLSAISFLAGVIGGLHRVPASRSV